MKKSRRNFVLAAAASLAAPAVLRCSAHSAEAVLHNPYGGGASRWLKGEIHTHLAHDATPAAKAAIFRSAKAAGFAFVTPSIEVTDALPVAAHYPQFSGGTEGVTAIPAREIQNNLYGAVPHFRDPGAEYLHLLQLSPGRGIGIDFSVIAHPRFYDMVGGQTGSWSGIRDAVLNPMSGGALAAFDPLGVEIFNGYTLSVLKRRGAEALYRDYDESCWDELLMRGRRIWGVAANDAFVEELDYARFAPLGCIYVASTNTSSIVGTLRSGRFYASTGVTLAPEPITVTRNGERFRFAVAAQEPVIWSAKLFDGRTLHTLEAPPGRTAEFSADGAWRYIRMQCRAPADPWRRAWLQPITR